VYAFVGADGDWPPYLCQQRILMRRQGLLHERDAGLRAGREVPFQIRRRPRLDVLVCAAGIGGESLHTEDVTDEEWARAEVIHPRKVAVGIKLDNDVLGWFRSQGKGYQTRINTVLRRYYEAHRKAG